jgi:hypothetical protein
MLMNLVVEVRHVQQPVNLKVLSPVELLLLLLMLLAMAPAELLATLGIALPQLQASQPIHESSNGSSSGSIASPLTRCHCLSLAAGFH